MLCGAVNVLEPPDMFVYLAGYLIFVFFSVCVCVKSFLCVTRCMVTVFALVVTLVFS